MLAPKYELDTTTHYLVIAIFNWIHYLTLTFDVLTLDSCHVMPLGWSIPVPSLNWIWLIIQELGQIQFSTDRQFKDQFF